MFTLYWIRLVDQTRTQSLFVFSGWGKIGVRLRRAGTHGKSPRASPNQNPFSHPPKKHKYSDWERVWAFPACRHTKLTGLPASMWLSTLDAGVAHLRSVTEMAPKTAFLYVKHKLYPVWFSCRHKSYPVSCEHGLIRLALIRMKRLSRWRICRIVIGRHMDLSWFVSVLYIV